MSVNEFDEIHRIYIRMVELANRLLEHPQLGEFASDPLTCELLVQIQAVGQEAARLKILTTNRLPPGFGLIWREILAAPSDVKLRVEST